MKRKMYSILSILLATVLLFSFASCNQAMDASKAPSEGGAENFAPPNNTGGNNNSNNDYKENAGATAPELSPIAPEGGKDDAGIMSPEGGMEDAGIMSPEGSLLPSEPTIPGEPGEPGDPENNDSPDKFMENSFVNTEENNVSTLSADVDTASYTYFRKLVNSGYGWEELMRYAASALRTEEFLNYFKYTAAQPSENELFSVNSTLFPCPWNEQTVLFSMTLQAADATPAEGNNLVFLIDVSGSMMSADKLPLLKKSFSFLTDQLGENDIISIVTYSGKEAVVLDGCSGSKKETILSAINSLVASGSTNGQAGLQKAYQIAEKHRIEGGNNRIIMASDGDLNVGITSESELKNYITQKREAGIFLSVLGFGTGNYRDEKMETLADNGNGVYLYVDGEAEAEKIFSTDLLANLYTVAKDVKMQITFDKTYVSSFRLIGYENRILNEEDFTDDTKDAGEVGAGHQVTVFYELCLTEAAMTENTNWLELAVNYKLPEEAVSVLPNLYNIGYADYTNTPNEDRIFMTAVIETCMLLHNSEYLPEDFGIDDVIENLSALDLSNYPERAEFRDLLIKLNTK